MKKRTRTGGRADARADAGADARAGARAVAKRVGIDQVNKIKHKYYFFSN